MVSRGAYPTKWSSMSIPETYLVGLLTIVIVGTAAALIPARKMVKMNPSQALHYE